MCDDFNDDFDSSTAPRVHARGLHAGELLFRCAYCGAQKTATVIGEAMASLEGKGEDSERIVREMADARALFDAERLVSIARCPCCGRRNRPALARVVARSVSAGLGVGIVGFVVALVWCQMTRLQLPQAAEQPAVIAGLIAVGLSGFKLVRYLQRSSRIVF